MDKLTEIEKTIVLSFLILTKSSTEKYLKKDEVVLKFPRQQRKVVRASLEKLVGGRLLVKNPEDDSYRLTKEGLERGSKILSEGVALPRLK